MKVKHYECDECGTRTRRITIHTSEFPGHEDHPAWEDLHFCGTLCMDTYFSDVLNEEHLPADISAPNTYWLTGQDIRDGA